MFSAVDFWETQQHTIHDGHDTVPPRLLVVVCPDGLVGHPTDITALALDFAGQSGGMYGESNVAEESGVCADQDGGR